MPISVEKYVAMPPAGDDSTDELIQGEIVLSLSAKPLHAKIVRRLLKLLEPLEDAGYELATDFGCILGEHSLPGPDLAAVSRKGGKTCLRTNTSGEAEFRVGELVEFSGMAIPIDQIFASL